MANHKETETLKDNEFCLRIQQASSKMYMDAYEGEKNRRMVTRSWQGTEAGQDHPSQLWVVTCVSVKPHLIVTLKQVSSQWFAHESPGGAIVTKSGKHTPHTWRLIRHDDSTFQIRRGIFGNFIGNGSKSKEGRKLATLSGGNKKSQRWKFINPLDPGTGF